MTLRVVICALSIVSLFPQAFANWAQPTIIKQTTVRSAAGGLSKWTCTIAGTSVVIVNDFTKKVIKRRTLTWDSEFTPSREELLQEIAKLLSKKSKVPFKVKKDAKRVEQIWVADQAKSSLVGQMAIQPEYQNWNSPYSREVTGDFVWAQCQLDESFAKDVENVKKMTKGQIELWPPTEVEEPEE